MTQRVALAKASLQPLFWPKSPNYLVATVFCPTDFSRTGLGLYWPPVGRQDITL